MFVAYILENLVGGWYIGSTSNIQERLKRHNQDRERATKGMGPWKLIYCEEFNSRSEAYKREMYLKKLKNKKYIKDLISNVEKTPRSGSSIG